MSKKKQNADKKVRIIEADPELSKKNDANRILKVAAYCRVMMKTDVLIIGAGAVGCALARELSKYNIKVTVCDKNDDVGGDASKSNSGLFSTSATMPVGTLECRLRTIAHSMIMNVCKDLDVPVIECGSIAPILYPEQLETAKGLTERAFQNGVYDY